MTTTGAVVLDRYRLEHEVGSGGVGVVWRATDEVLDLTVALKRVSFAALGAAAGKLTMERTLREARLAAKLRGEPNVVPLYDVQVADGDVWLVLEYLPSQSLSQILAERPRLPPGEVARIGADVARALAAAHARGIRHRDVTPGNVLIGTEGQVKLTDFGIAHGETDPRLTQTGLITGTVAYMAPEAARGDEAGTAADIFSLGATMYAAVEGAPPFGTAANPVKLLNIVGNGVVSPPQNAGGLRPLLMRTLEVDPNTRPDAATLSEQLRRLATELSESTVDIVRRNTGSPSAPVRPAPVTSETTDTYRPMPAPQRKRWPAVLVGVGVLVALALLGGVLTYDPSTPGTAVAASQAGQVAGQSAGQAAPTAGPGAPDAPAGPRFGANLTNVDTCALLDKQALSRFGTPTISRGTYIEGCHAMISDGENDTYIGLSFDPPAAERPSYEGKQEQHGEITVTRQAERPDPADPECNNYVVLADNSVLYVDAYPDEIDQRVYVNLCKLANSATDTAVPRLQRGIPRSDALLSQFSLASKKACSLVDERTLSAVPNLAYRTADSGFADWSCYWGADAEGAPYVSLEFRLEAADTLDTYGDPTTVSGRRAFQRQEDSSYTEQKCVLRLEHRQPGPSGGPSEVLQIGVSSTQPAAQRCAMARAIGASAERHLS